MSIQEKTENSQVLTCTKNNIIDVMKLHGRNSGLCLVGPWIYHSSTECAHDPEKAVVSSQIQCNILAKILTQLADWVEWVNIQIIDIIHTWVEYLLQVIIIWKLIMFWNLYTHLWLHGKALLTRLWLATRSGTQTMKNPAKEHEIDTPNNAQTNYSTATFYAIQL